MQSQQGHTLQWSQNMVQYWLQLGKKGQTDTRILESEFEINCIHSFHNVFCIISCHILIC